MHFTLLNKNTPVADVSFDMRRGYIADLGQVYNPEFAPLGVVNENKVIDIDHLSDWWEERSIPDSRKNVEKVLEHIQKDKQELIAKSLGLSLSDQYWIKPVGADVEWRDVNFFTNDFSREVGELFFYQKGIEDSDRLNYSSPDLTSNGFLDKRWLIEGGERYLCKNGFDTLKQQPFNEVIASDMLETVGCKDFVTYALRDADGEPYSMCKNFVTEHTEYVPATLIRKIAEKEPNEKEYAYFMRCCERLQVKDLMVEYLNYTLPFDYLIGNVDRNYGNFGVIRNVETLRIEKAAPIFDNGNSLWYNDLLLTPEVKAYPFEFTQEAQIKLAVNPGKFPVQRLRDLPEICARTLRSNKQCSPERIRQIGNALTERKRMLQRVLNRGLHR